MELAVAQGASFDFDFGYGNGEHLRASRDVSVGAERLSSRRGKVISTLASSTVVAYVRLVNDARLKAYFSLCSGVG